MKSIGRDQEKNRAEIILEESGKLSVEEQERVLAACSALNKISSLEYMIVSAFFKLRGV